MDADLSSRKVKMKNPKLSDTQLEAVRSKVKQKASTKLKIRKFWVAVIEEPESIDVGESNYIIMMDVMTCGPGDDFDGFYQVFVPEELFNKRVELFRAGHRLVLVAETDDTPILYLRDAWFDRGELL
jgi:hypothetical protein